MYFTNSIFAILLGNMMCHPVFKTDANELKSNKPDEKRYENGTVVGKYMYMDRDGNPVHVKYYADEASYGVELKTVKITGKPDQLQQSNQNFDSNKKLDADHFINEASNLGSSLDSNDLLNIKLPAPNKNTIGNDFHKRYSANFEAKALEEPNKFCSRPVQPKDGVNKVTEYEVFESNELEAPEKCGKQKVHVYVDKNKRKLSNYGVVKRHGKRSVDHFHKNV